MTSKRVTRSSKSSSKSHSLASTDDSQSEDETVVSENRDLSHYYSSNQNGREQISSNLKHFLAEFDIEVESRGRLLVLKAENTANSLRNAFELELLRIPTNIRKMKWREFKQKYGADIDNITDEKINKLKESFESTPFARRVKTILESTSKDPTNSTARRVTRSQSQIIEQTGNILPADLPKTPRHYMRGENLISINGSPVTFENESTTMTTTATSTATAAASKIGGGTKTKARGNLTKKKEK